LLVLLLVCGLVLRGSVDTELGGRLVHLLRGRDAVVPRVGALGEAGASSLVGGREDHGGPAGALIPDVPQASAQSRDVVAVDLDDVPAEAAEHQGQVHSRPGIEPVETGVVAAVVLPAVLL